VRIRHAGNQRKRSSHLITTDLAPCSGLELPQLEPANAHALQPTHLVSDCREQTTHFAILAFPELDHHVRLPRRGFADGRRFGPELTHSSRERHRLFGGDPPPHRHDVYPRNRVGRVREAIGQIRVGREEQEAAARKVQAPDCDKAVRFIAKRVEHGWSTLGIAPCRHHAARLVKKNGSPRPLRLRRVIDRHPQAMGDDKSCWALREAAVDANAACENGGGCLRA
jgi:hypothetical protein